MKKTLSTIIFMLLLFTLTMMADNAKTKIKRVELTIDEPKAGMTVQQAEELKLRQAKTAYGDLATTGDIKLQELEWDGEFDESDEEHPKFKPGFTYQATVRLMINPEGKYTTDYVFKSNDYYLDETRFSATINGKPCRMTISPPYFPILKMNFTIGGTMSQASVKAMRKEQSEQQHEDLSTNPALSTSDADALWVGKQAKDVLILNSENKPSGGYSSRMFSNKDSNLYPGQQQLFITKLIIDIGDDDTADGLVDPFAYCLSDYVQGPQNLREVWLSKKVNVEEFVKALNDGMVNEVNNDYQDYMFNDFMFMSARATLCIPEESAAKVRQILASTDLQPVYTVKTYSSDVYAAQKAGVDAAKPLCTKHDFRKKIKAADRIYRYEDCQKGLLWYYSCQTCGKCEHNPNHTFSQRIGLLTNGPVGKTDHCFKARLATDEAYIGKNAAGEHLYWLSCIWCGHSSNYYVLHPTLEDYKRLGDNSGTFEGYKRYTIDALKTNESQALLQTSVPLGMFGLSDKATAKVSPTLQSSVNHALSNNLADESLLGTDYTVNATCRQIGSMAVNLVRQLTGKSVEMQTILDLLPGNTIALDKAASRQEAAAILYAALRCVEKNSDYTYSDYNSRLSSYTDVQQLKSWAKEPVTFMEALGLIVPQTSKTLAPNALCSIEQALAIAERCMYAHKAGWWQAVAYGEAPRFSGKDYITAGNRNCNSNIFVGPSYTPKAFAYSDRVWVTLYQPGIENYLPTVDPYSKQTVYIDGKWFRPVRWRAGKVQSDEYMLKGSSKASAGKSGSSKKKGKSKGSSILGKGLSGLKSILR